MWKNKTMLLLASCLIPRMACTQSFGGEYTAEWQWNMNKNTNFVHLLRLEMHLPLWKGGSLEAATMHIARTNAGIIDDWQTFSNIEEESNVAAIGVCGYLHTWRNVHLFVGVRNVNEDFFTSDVTSLFTNSSCGIFPTLSASYPIANYPLSGWTVYGDVRIGRWSFKNSLCNGAGYNGWTRHNHPFLILPKRDGVFDMAQAAYEHPRGHCFAGVALHTRQCRTDETGEMSSAKESIKKVSGAWWVYAEQSVWSADERSLFLMAQYSENTDRQNGCSRYAEMGSAFFGKSHRFGLSVQYARFFQGTEQSLEATWSKTLNESLFVQPALQYIKNENGYFVVLSARIHYCF